MTASRGEGSVEGDTGSSVGDSAADRLGIASEELLALSSRAAGGAGDKLQADKRETPLWKRAFKKKKKRRDAVPYDSGSVASSGSSQASGSTAADLRLGWARGQGHGAPRQRGRRHARQRWQRGRHQGEGEEAKAKADAKAQAKAKSPSRWSLFKKKTKAVSALSPRAASSRENLYFHRCGFPRQLPTGIPTVIRAAA